MLLRRYQTGGQVAAPVSVNNTTGPVDVYEGHEQWPAYQASLIKNKQYNKFNTESTNMSNSGDYTQPTQFTTQQFQAANPQFTNIEGATGVTRYKYDSNNAEGYTPQQYVFSDPNSGYTYIPTYASPETQYNVVEDPAIVKQKEQAATWKQANIDNGIKGYTKVRYSAGGGKWDYELRPIKGNQAIPTDGSFVDYNTVGGDDIYKIVGGAPKANATPTQNQVAVHKKGGLLKVPKNVLKNKEIKVLVKFGNFLLSDDRKKLVSKLGRGSVNDADLANHFGKKYKGGK